jgi:hypothetical protein
MEYADEAAQYVKSHDSAKYAELVGRIKFDDSKEIAKWREIRSNMFYPEDKTLGVYLQQEGYMDKEQILVKDLDVKERPLNQKGAGIAFYALALSNRPMFCRVCTSLRIDLIPIPSNETTSFTRLALFTSHRFRLAYIVFWHHALEMGAKLMNFMFVQPV